MMKLNSNLDYFLYWLWIWTLICKINRESSWICALGFRFQVFWTSFNLFQMNESQDLLIHLIHRLFFVYGPLMKIWGETRRSFRDYLDFSGDSNTDPWESFWVLWFLFTVSGFTSFFLLLFVRSSLRDRAWIRHRRWWIRTGIAKQRFNDENPAMDRWES